MVVIFEIADMTCGHCVASITEAVRSVDDAATVLAELATHRVRIASEVASIESLRAAIAEAGYTPVAVGDLTSGSMAEGPRSDTSPSSSPSW